MRQPARLLGTVAAISLVLVMLPSVAAQAVRVPETLSHRAPVTAGPVLPGFPIDHLGVLWDDAGLPEQADAHVGHGAVRFRHNGSWGDWIPLIKDGAPGEGLWASGLVPGGGAEAFQVRGIPVGAGSPRTVAFNTSDGPLRTTGVRFGGPAAVGNCVSREEWGADESLRHRQSADFADVQVMTMHHTATGNNDSDPAGTVRAIYQYHTIDNGWRDIGYNYLISEDGSVFEGRWSGALGDSPTTDTYSQACSEGGSGADFAHDSAGDGAWVAQGAHAGGYNTGNIGIALLGSFNNRGRYQGEPKAAAVSAAEHLLAELSARHGIDPEGTVDYDNGVNSKRVAAISGHQDFNATECPGDNLYADLPRIRSAVAALLDPTPPGTDTTPAVSITSPSDGASFGSGAAIAFAGSALDAEDGDLTDSLVWTSDRDGSIGTGGSFDAGLSDGTHTITVTVADSGSNQGQGIVTVIVGSPPSEDGIALAVTGSKVRGGATVELSWTGTTAPLIEVRRDGETIGTTENDGVHTDFLGKRVSGTFTYQVCEAGTTTANCSNEAAVAF